LTAWILLIVGLLVLVGGADALVRGGVGLGDRLGISPLVMGLTVIAFGTSAPEVAVALGAVGTGRPDLAMGNAVGSNTFNVLFILGVSALVRPLIVQQKLVRVDVPLMIMVSVLLWVLSIDGMLGLVDAFVLLLGFAGYLGVVLLSVRRESRGVRAKYASVAGGLGVSEKMGEQPRRGRRRSLWLSALMLVAGLGAAVVGARLVVGGASSIARGAGMSELVIGLTVVAAGTSLPEMAASLVAAFRGQRDMAVGNVVGSNIFNVLCILGLSGLLADGGLVVSGSLLSFDIPVMVAASVACLPIVFTGHAIWRWEGASLLVGYAAYVAYLVLDAIGHDALDGFERVALWFALPLVALGVAGSVGNALIASRRVGRH